MCVISDQHPKNSTNPNQKNSDWWSDWPDDNDIRIQTEGLFGLTKFFQGDYRKCLDGGVNIVFSSLYPIENGFVRPKLLGINLPNKLVDHVTEFGRPRIKFIQRLKDYFPDLEKEYEFTVAHSGKVLEVDGMKYMYKLSKTIVIFAVKFPPVMISEDYWL